MAENRIQRGGCAPFIIAAVVLSLPILYFLSSGPVFVLTEYGSISGRTYRTIYAPLVFVSERSPAIHDGWRAYVRLWIGDD